MDQQLAQVHIATFRDPLQARPAAGRLLPGNEAKPSRKVAPACKTLAVTDSRHKGGGIEHADPRNSGQTSGAFVLAGPRRKFIVESTDAPVQLAPFLPHILDQRANPHAEGWITSLQYLGECLAQLAPPLRNDDAALHQHGAELIDQRGALCDKPVTGTVKHLHVELLSRFQFDKPHRRPRRRLGDRFRVTVIVLLRLHVGTHILR